MTDDKWNDQNIELMTIKMDFYVDFVMIESVRLKEWYAWQK